MLSLSLQAVYDDDGERITDALLHVYQAGTTTPAPSYADAGYANLRTDPVKARGNGTLPVVYVPTGVYRLRITDSFGRQIDQIEDYAVLDPVVRDEDDTGLTTQIAQTGDEKWRYGTGPHAGWVRENGRTIGSDASSATERADDDCHDLFVFLWAQDANLAVAGGRGTDAEGDWLAGKTIALPDMRGRTLVGLDDMGAAAAGRLNGGTFAFGGATMLGAYGGLPSASLVAGQIPSHSHTATATMDVQGRHAHSGTTEAVGDHAHSGTVDANGLHGHNGTVNPNGSHAHAQNYSVGTAGSGNTNRVVTDLSPSGNNNAGGQNEPTGNHNHTFRTDADGQHAHTFTSNPAGSHAHNLTTGVVEGHQHNVTVTVSAQGNGDPFNLLQPFSLRTLYIKL